MLVGAHSHRAIPQTFINILDGTDCGGPSLFFWDGFGGQNLQQPMDIQNYTHVFWTISQIERHRGFWDVAYIWSSGVYVKINPYMCLWLPHDVFIIPRCSWMFQMILSCHCWDRVTIMLLFDMFVNSLVFVPLYSTWEFARKKYVFNIIMLKPVQPSSG